MQIFALLVSSAAALELSPANFAEKTAGKSVFLKFFAPWCGHCKAMKPAWDELMTEFADSKSAVIADVDCTGAGQELCQQHGVQGYPTVKYGDPEDLQDYQGGRDLESLKEFAKTNLGPICSPSNMDLCDAEKKEKLEELMKMTTDDLSTKITEEEKKITDAEELFKTELEKLQKKYEELSKTKDDDIKAVKDSGLGMMKSVRKFLEKDAKKEEL